ncbi:hypothetical protein TNCV_2421961 [Trichonephila clavipes]|nr:hypothetical protein TNCV_2421961 [Trichonephila clavipes]
MIFYAWPNYWKDRRRAKNNRCFQEFDIAHSVVSRLWKSFKTTGMCSRQHGEVVLEVRRPQKTDISSNQQKKERAHHSPAGGKSVSCCLRKADLPKTVARRLRGGGLYARRPVVCPIDQTAPYCPFAMVSSEHHNWTEQDWACVLFSDESRFSLSSDCRRQLIWRESGTAYRPEKYPGKGPVSDMQYHGVGRHHDQWPHAPTCGCEWDYDGTTIH